MQDPKTIIFDTRFRVVDIVFLLTGSTCVWLYQGFRMIKTERLFGGNPTVCRTGVAYDKAASSSLL